MEGFQNRNFMTHASQITGSRQTRRASAHNGHPAHILGTRANLNPFTDGVVRHKSLQPADGHWFILNTENALLLALLLLRAYAAADCGEAVGLDNLVVRTHVVFLGDQRNEVANLNLHRAPLFAEGILALQATRGLAESQLFVIAQGNLIKVPDALGAGLSGHGISVRSVCFGHC